MSDTGGRLINGGSGVLDKFANHTIFVLASRVLMMVAMPVATWIGSEIATSIKALIIQQINTQTKLELLVQSVDINAKNEARLDAIREQRFEDWLKLRDQRLDRLERLRDSRAPQP